LQKTTFVFLAYVYPEHIWYKVLDVESCKILEIIGTFS